MSKQKEQGASRVVIYREDLGLFSTSSPSPHLIGGRCKACGNYMFPKYLACPKCFSDEVEAVPLSSNGTLHSFTNVQRAMPEFAVPFVLGLVDFPEGVRVMAQIETENPENLEIGMEMEVTTGVIRKNKEGQDVISYKFRPAQPG